LTFHQYYRGNIYSARWIYESVKNKKFMKRDDYFLCINVDASSKRLNIAKKKKYTIIEGLKLFETVSSHKGS
jgi:hypothetical protein